MITIYLDSDESQVVQIENLDKITSVDDLLLKCKKKFKLTDIDISQYGFLTKQQQILIKDIGDIIKARKVQGDEENFMKDKDYYDDNLKTDTLVFRNLNDEGEVAIEDMKAITKDLKKAAKSDKPRKAKDHIGIYKKISYNIRAEQDTYVDAFVRLDGIKEIMQLIEESQEA